jgi:hypothetical protein
MITREFGGAQSYAAGVTWPAAVARLTCILAGVGLVTTRLGLIAHELIGHGATAIALGGEIVTARLYWFGGGWIRYEMPDPISYSKRLAVSLGGIAFELVVGMAMWIALARRTSLVGKILRAVGAALALHALWYLAVGTYHGYGDGQLLRWLTEDGHYAIAIIAGAALCVLAFFAARAILGVLAATLPTRRVAGMLIAIVVAAGFQGALLIVEMEMRPDPSYMAIMATEGKRVVQRELSEWEKEQRERGIAIDEAARRARERAIAAQHRELPFLWILGACALLAIAAGWWRSKDQKFESIPPRLVYTISAMAVGSVALVIAIDALFV